MSSAKAKDRVIIFLGIFVTILALGGAFVLGDYSEEETEKPEGGDQWVTASYTAVFDSSLTEGSSEDQGMTLDEKKVESITLVLTWQDEPSDARHTNTPDTFRLEVSSEAGSDTREDSGGRIEMSFTAPADEPWDLDGKELNITVTAVSCGDQEPLIPDPLGFRTITDGGNSYNLEVEIKFLAKEVTQEG